VEFLAFFFAAHIDFNTEITDDETVFVITDNFKDFFNNLINLTEEIGAEYRIANNGYLVIITKLSYKIDSQFRALGY